MRRKFGTPPPRGTAARARAVRSFCSCSMRMRVARVCVKASLRVAPGGWRGPAPGAQVHCIAPGCCACTQRCAQQPTQL